jgi:Tfp pilus assembly major pilin PilA
MLRKLLIALGIVVVLAVISVLAIQIPQRLG